MKTLAVIPFLIMCSGCASILDNMIDDAFETKEERQVRRDTSRWKRGDSLQHHRGVDHLKSHRQEMWFQDWNKDRYLDKLEDRAEHQRQIQRMEEEHEFYEQIREIPIDDSFPVRLRSQTTTVTNTLISTTNGLNSTPLRPLNGPHGAVHP